MWNIPDDTKTMICSVLELFDSYGLLHHYLLIGGWAAYTHQQNTEGLDYLPNITNDLDFAIHPRIHHPRVPLVTELEMLGYETTLHQDTQVAKFKHPALDLEFLLTPTGRADKAVRYAPLGLFFDQFAYLHICFATAIQAELFGYTVRIPSMSRFGLLKILISDLRIGINNPKRENDANTGIHLLHFLSQDANRWREVQDDFGSFPVPWKKKVLKPLENRLDNDPLVPIIYAKLLEI
jgi:hypothetical protein